MLLGLMNHPQRELPGEVARVAELGFDFLDLTLEPPRARVDRVDLGALRELLQGHGLGVVGHTAYYLPFASPFDAVHEAAVLEAVRCLEAFAAVGARWMNVHLDGRAPMHDARWVAKRNVAALAALLEPARALGVGVMVENLAGDDAERLAPVLDALPEVGLHLDVGHANLRRSGSGSAVAGLLRRYGERLAHVHLSDNKGRSDDHLAIGAGSIDWEVELAAVKASGYDATLTLETFHGDRELIAYGRDKVRALWAGS